MIAEVTDAVVGDVERGQTTGVRKCVEVWNACVGGGRPAGELIFGDVLVRVDPSFKLAMHIDTDEGNAANVKTGAQGYIDGIQSEGYQSS